MSFASQQALRRAAERQQQPLDSSSRRGPRGRRCACPISLRPIPAKLFRTKDNAVDDIMRILLWIPRICGVTCRRNFQHLQFFEHGLHGANRIAEKIRASDAGEDPTHAFKHGLPVHVFGKLFERVKAVPVALDSEALTVTFNNQVDTKLSNFPVRGDPITRRHESFHDFSFEARLRATFVAFQRAHETRRVFPMLDQLSTEVVGL